MTTNPQTDLVAIGVLAQQLQQPVRMIEAVCLAINLAPAMRINFVPHFSGEQVDRIAARLAEVANGSNPLPLHHQAKNAGSYSTLPVVGKY